MGCWGIKALESDEGLDIIIELEKILPKDGHLQLEKLSGGSKCWDAYGDVCEDGKVHTKPMVLAEVIMAYLDGEQYRLYGGSDKKSKEMNFAKITQFEGKRKTVMVIRNYLKDMLRRSRERSKEYQWNGWLKEENWIGWQGHVENLIKRLEELLERKGILSSFGMQECRGLRKSR